MLATTIQGGRVRGTDQQTGHLFGYLPPEEQRRSDLWILEARACCGKVSH